MENEDNKRQQLTSKERILYFGLIPLMFTLALMTFAALLIRQGHSKDFSSATVGVVKSAGALIKKGYDWAVTKPSPPAVTASQAGNTSSAAVPNAGGGTSTSSGGSGTKPNPAASSAAAAASATPSSGPDAATDTAMQFKKKTDEIAAEFSKMQPAQAASIIATMSTKDAVFAMIGMKTQQRANILTKMDPKQAADLSQALKDFPPDNTVNAAEVQGQLNKLPAAQKAVADLIKTYSQMPAHSAAILLMDLMKTNEPKAISIMKGLDTNIRAQILSDMSNAKTNPDGLKYATMITNKLLH